MSSSRGKTLRLQRAVVRGNGQFSQENVCFGGLGRGSVMDTWSAIALGEDACRKQGAAGQWEDAGSSAGARGKGNPAGSLK